MAIDFQPQNDLERQLVAAREDRMSESTSKPKTWCRLWLWAGLTHSKPSRTLPAIRYRAADRKGSHIECHSATPVSRVPTTMGRVRKDRKLTAIGQIPADRSSQ